MAQAQAQPDLVPHRELDVMVMLVVGALVNHLGLLQGSTSVSQKFVAFSHAFGNRTHPRFS